MVPDSGGLLPEQAQLGKGCSLLGFVLGWETAFVNMDPAAMKIDPITRWLESSSQI